MLNQSPSWPCDMAEMNLRLALRSIPMCFISPLPAICRKIQSYTLKAREQFLCMIQVPLER